MYELIRSALRKPISVMVGIIAVIFFAILSLFRIPVDIFPALNLPTIYIVQPYGGMAPDQMDAFIATRYQDHFLYVSGIKNVEIKSIQGLCLIKLEFYPDADMAQAAGEIANQVTRAKSYMPEGTVPPQVVRFDASAIPIGQLLFSSKTKTLNEIQDIAGSRVRPMFAKIEGVSAPPPLGGNQRSIVIKVDPTLMRSYKLSADEVVKMIAQSNQPSPAGNIRIGDKTYMTPVNSLVKKPEDFLNVPVRLGVGQEPTVFVRDIAVVEDAADITVSYALINGKRAVYIPVMKKADASTLAVVNNVKKALPEIVDAIPEDVSLSYEFDQSVYVKHALSNLLTEGILGAVLTGLMVLLFLRDWRSVVIVVLTIPISILGAISLLNLFGQSINIMTLSGLALAVGVLVDEATVTIENIHQHFERRKSKSQAIWDACKEIAFPKFLILVAILAVFAPSFLMQGVPKSLFLPLSLSVGFSMIASFLLSQTFVPVVANWLLKVDGVHHEPSSELTGFNKFKHRYTLLLKRIVFNKKRIIAGYITVTLLFIIAAFLFIGTDIFPKSNAKQFQIKLRAPDGTRIERTEEATIKLLNIIKAEVGDENVAISSSFVGTVPSSYGTSNTLVFNSGPHESIVQVSLSNGFHANMEDIKEKLRRRFSKELPSIKTSFEPIDMIEKIISQGSMTPLEVTVASKDLKEAEVHALKIIAELNKVPFLRDVQIAQPLHYPTLKVDINRERAAEFGITSTQIAKSMVAATSSSRFVEKNLWLDDKKGQAYQVQVQIPENLMTKIEDLNTITLKSNSLYPVLADVATITAGSSAAEYDRSGPNRLVTITANLHQKDLGSGIKEIRNAIANVGKAPRGVVVDLKGQSNLLDETLESLQVGLFIAVVIIFLLLAANFQSFQLSLITLSTLPAVITGALLLLLLSGATLNLQSYMGLIMSVGVSIANSILLITNAEELRRELKDARKAALRAANARIRPIIMTSLAMVAGMIPMALGLGEGGEQTAPLGQAVIGGLIASTFASLLILPALYILIQQKASVESVSLDPEDVQSKYYIKKQSEVYEMSI